VTQRGPAWRIVWLLPALAAATAASAFAALPVGKVYPSGPTVPENLLRIELRLTAPLPAPLVVEHIRLLDADGREIQGAFLDLLLPTADATRFSLLLHPGRVKSGIGANLALGRALHAGAPVTLRIDDPSLGRPIRKRWRVTAFDADPPDPLRWNIKTPSEGRRSALLVLLHAPISSTAESLIAIRGPYGQRVNGRTRLERGETVWRFIPDQPWRAGRYALVTHPDLEDPAGNRACAPFEGFEVSAIRCDQGTVQPFTIAR
jgi:hypothetical protein